MRRAALPISCLTAVLLVLPAVDQPASTSLAQPVGPVKASAASGAGQRALSRISRAVPPVPQRTARALTGTGSPEQRPADAAVARAAGPERAYTVRSGDSLWSIARRHGVGVERLAAANRLTITAVLRPGQALKIPPEGAAEAPAKTPVVHVVQPGDTLWDIANRYGALVEDLMALNNLGHSEWIMPGQRLVISGGALPRHRQIAGQSRRDGSASGQALAGVAALRVSGGLAWPSRGNLTSRFGWRHRSHHDGIDLAAPRGTPFYAAADGVVEFAGWERGYGRTIYVSHSGGVVTIYGHASKILVEPGERVIKGQLIGRVGCTGSCTGSHLHFEVRVNGRAADPLKYLR